MLCVKHLTFIWNSADCLNANLIFVRVNACSFIWRSGSDWAQRNYILQKAMCILRLGDILTLVKLYINNSRFYQKQRKKKIISRRRERCRGASEAWWCSDSTWCKPTSRTSGDILFSLIWPIGVIPSESFRINFYIISDCCRWSSAPRTRCTCHSITWSSEASYHPNISRPRIFAKQNQQTAPLNLTKLRHKNILGAKNIEHYEAFVSVPKINKTCI